MARTLNGNRKVLVAIDGHGVVAGILVRKGKTNARVQLDTPPQGVEVDAKGTTLVKITSMTVVEPEPTPEVNPAVDQTKT